VRNDAVARGFGWARLLTSAHGTVIRHYRHHQGEATSTNPIASIFAWTRGLTYRGRIDGTPEVERFASTLEQVCIATVEGDQMTKDLAILIGPNRPWLTTEHVLDALDKNLQTALAKAS
jgi:isocitrate dehydrogenase